MFGPNEIPTNEEFEYIDDVEYDFLSANMRIDKNESERIPLIVPVNTGEAQVAPYQVIQDNFEYLVDKTIESIKRAYDEGEENAKILAIKTQAQDSVSEESDLQPGMGSLQVLLSKRENWIFFLRNMLKELEDREDYENCAKVSKVIDEYKDVLE